MLLFHLAFESPKELKFFPVSFYLSISSHVSFLIVLKMIDANLQGIGAGEPQALFPFYSGVLNLLYTEKKEASYARTVYRKLKLNCHRLIME